MAVIHLSTRAQVIWLDNFYHYNADGILLGVV